MDFVDKHPIKTVVVIFILVGFYYWAKSPNKEVKPPAPKEKIYCYTCNKDLTESSNRIQSPAAPNQTHEIWYCTPCWRVAWKEAEDAAEAQGY